MTPFNRMVSGTEPGNYTCLATYHDEADLPIAIDYVKMQVRRGGVPANRITIRNNAEHKTVYAQVREYED